MFHSYWLSVSWGSVGPAPPPALGVGEVGGDPGTRQTGFHTPAILPRKLEVSQNTPETPPRKMRSGGMCLNVSVATFRGNKGEVFVGRPGGGGRGEEAGGGGLKPGRGAAATMPSRAEVRGIWQLRPGPFSTTFRGGSNLSAGKRQDPPPPAGADPPYDGPWLRREVSRTSSARSSMSSSSPPGGGVRVQWADVSLKGRRFVGGGGMNDPDPE